MAKKLKQSHFCFYLQNRPLKFCIEDIYTPLPPPKSFWELAAKWPYAKGA